ncbi:hypothetical protein A7975_20615 [Bacillus sp. FJAT-26390]|uniref:hypothetical protein n=1 Tax=Paenibacillus sp. FJAT-27812 TaxID=1684143 RepID=UPI0006A77690|nr:hypothetical protein [Paenibacillus sp. FJAT-27812]OBZ11348.1 hypothetical protein A7975_20615 [Bacillus sp. FJAT-26390]
MTYMDMLGRRSIILKRNIGNLVIKDNKQGLSAQESNFYHSMIKEWHQNESELNAVRKHP